VEQVAGLEGVAAHRHEVVAGGLDLIHVGEHFVDRRPPGRVDAGGLRDMHVVVDDAVDMDACRDLADFAVDLDRLADRGGEVRRGADPVEQIADRLAETAVADVAIDVGIAGQKDVGRRTGDDEADDRAAGAGLLVRHGQLLDGVALRLQRIDEDVESGDLALVGP
jgi:hypothetical protein